MSPWKRLGVIKFLLFAEYSFAGYCIALFIWAPSVLASEEDKVVMPLFSQQQNIPWHRIGKLSIQKPHIQQSPKQKMTSCTATLVAANLIVSAAHCLYDSEKKAYIHPEKLTFYAGLKGDLVSAATQITSYTVPSHTFPSGQFEGSALLIDWAVLELEQSIGCFLGHFPLWHQHVGGIEALITAGYAQGSAQYLTKTATCQSALPRNADSMWRLKNCALTKGDSGAPILVKVKGHTTPYIAGVISAGANDSHGRFRVVAVPSEQFSNTVNSKAKPCTGFDW
ncbi:trypsin-like serine protease [uncultured Shewanella sp.]|uniref:trypsin-like serine peptidase n=1 Tax=uncultured Shewanella sp. TaxID=173975 RepID=UPI0026158BE0|nr:trypsin-like serine protease [uncultured Shewanella sp.]